MMRELNHTRSAGKLAGLVAAGFWVVAALAPSAWATQTGTRVSAFEYHATTGLLTKEILEPDTTQDRLETTYTHDAFGNKVTVTVSSPATGAQAITSRTSTSTFDANGRFATGASNALSQAETRAFDPLFGAPTSLTGPNGLTTTWTYDSFGRKTEETRSDGTKTKWEYLFCSGVAGGSASCPTGAKYLTRTKPVAADGTTPTGPTVTGYFDMLGREIRAETQGFDGGGSAPTVVVDTVYDANGRAEKKSKPYFLSGGTPEWTSFQYDAIGRVTQETRPGFGTTVFTFNALVTVSTNHAAQTLTKTVNSQGKTVTSQDHLSGVTSFAYDAFGNLKQTTDAAGNVSTHVYDVRGRKIQSIDPDMGTWTYTYDVLGQLVDQFDAKGQTTLFTYDKLGRQLTRTEGDLVSTWTYDTATKGVGKPATSQATGTASGGGNERTYAYDSQGRPSQVVVEIGVQTYTIAASYDAVGRVDVLTYPSGFAVKHVYTALGYLKEVRNNATNAVLWQLDATRADQQLLATTHGNGVQTSYGYDSEGRLNAIQAGAGNLVQNLGYSYDAISNLIARTDTHTVDELFGYDGLNRLTSSIIGATTKTQTFDAIGNILTKTGVGTYSYPSTGQARPHAVASISGALTTTYTYDANGNMLTGAGRTATWTSFNMPNTLARGASTLTFGYDDAHERIKQVAPDGTTLYVNGLGLKVERFAGTGGLVQWNNYIYAAGGIVGVFYERSPGPSITRYFHKDHLGSISVITDELGAVVERSSYDAWGKRRYNNGTDDPLEAIVSLTDRGFTGHEHLQEVGLVHMNGRVYDPLIARFMSADPHIQDPLNTQSLNRYSYVNNNPLAYTDPSGYFSIGKIFKSIFKAVVNLVQNPLALVAIAVAVAMPFVAPGIIAATTGLLAGTTGNALLTGFIGGALSGAIGSGGDLKSTFIAALTGAAFAGIGEWTGGDLKFLSERHLQNVAGHAVVGCASSAAGGGSCQAGALSAASGSFVGPLTRESGFAVRLAAAATVGGTASVLGGGKFANGAVTAAYGFLFNDTMHAAATLRLPWPLPSAIEYVTGKEFLASGASVGVAISLPGLMGGDADVGFFVQTNLRGLDVSIGTPYTGFEAGYGAGSVRDMSGIGLQGSFNDGIGGLTFNLNIDSNTSLPTAKGSSMALRLGPGYGAQVVPTTTSVWSLRPTLEKWFSPQSAPAK